MEATLEKKVFIEASPKCLSDFKSLDVLFGTFQLEAHFRASCAVVGCSLIFPPWRGVLSDDRFRCLAQKMMRVVIPDPDVLASYQVKNA